MKTQNIRAQYLPSQVKQIALDHADIDALAKDPSQLSKIGIELQIEDIVAMAHPSHGMDAAIAPGVTPGNLGAPVQFLQNFLPGAVNTITAVREIDNLVGMVMQGSWEDEEVVQRVMEHKGNPATYGDYTNVPMASWNQIFEKRSVVRFEEGMQVGKLEEARASRAQVSSAQEKRAAAMEALEIKRNNVGFYGYNDGQGRTYGFLNDVDLPAYVNLPNGSGGSSDWSSKTYLEIVSDLQTMYTGIRTQSKGKVDPNQDSMILAVALSAYDALIGTTTEYGVSVMDWLNKTYAGTRVVAVPELDGANGGDNVAYLYAETVRGTGSDDNATFAQVVPTKFMSLGVKQEAKYYEEAYSNATAGVMTKRPYAVFRVSGL